MPKCQECLRPFFTNTCPDCWEEFTKRDGFSYLIFESNGTVHAWTKPPAFDDPVAAELLSRPGTFAVSVLKWTCHDEHRPPADPATCYQTSIRNLSEAAPPDNADDFHSSR